MNQKSDKKIGLVYSISLVIGNMIGSGIFLLPASLAVYGNISLLGWIFSFLGAMILSVIFGNLSKLVPSAAGGPYEYTKQIFGPWPAYLVAWCYWASIWFGNAAIVVALLGYLGVFIPILKENVVAAICAGWIFIWLFTWINTKNIRFVGNVQLLTTILKVIPLLFIGVVGIFYIDYNKVNLAFEWNFSHLTAAVTLTFFAFQGIESATITSDQVAGDESTVKRATILGTLITSFIYMIGSFVVMALLGQEMLKTSTSPFADASSLFLGPWAKYLVAAGAVFSTLGALNGWILLQGHIPMAAAQDRLFPPVFGIKNQEGSPSRGIIITSIITSLLMLLNYINGLVSLFTLMISLSTLAVIVPYLSSVAAYFTVAYKNKNLTRKSKIFLPLTAFLFLFWVISGTGWETIFYGLSFILAGVLFYYATLKYRV